MDARLGVSTCDKCGELMEKGQNIIIVADGLIADSSDILEFRGTSVRYACHADCWDLTDEISE